MIKKDTKEIIVCIIELLIIISAIIWAYLGTKTVFVGETVTSRLATVYALIHNKTFYIRDSSNFSPNPFEQRTVDKVKGKEGIISSKPPIFSLIMAGEYLILKEFGYSLDNPQHLKPIVRFYIISLIIPLFALSLLIIWRFLHSISASAPVRIATLAVLAFGTHWSAFSPHFTNHLPGGALLIISLYCLWNIYRDKRSSIYGLLGGIFSSLVFTIDMPLTIFVAGGFLFLLWYKGLNKLIWIPIGALPVLLIHFSIMFHITGSILPVQISNAPFLFESSYWRHPVDVDALHHPKLVYTFNILVGPKGIFLLYPVLVLSLLNFLPKFWNSYSPELKNLFISLLICFIVLNIYYILSTNNYGGMSYGFRWHAGSMPILALASIPFLEKVKKNKLFWVCWFFLFAISLYSSFECRQHPWSIDKEWTTRLIFGPLI